MLQRVSRASVEVDGTCVGRIERGWLVLLGVAAGDTEEDAAWVADKVLNLRGFEDDAGKMNRSVLDVRGRHSGRQPVHAAGRLPRRAAGPASPRRPIPPWPSGSISHCAERLAGSGLEVATGVFRAMMKVELVNDGPVTLSAG